MSALSLVLLVVGVVLVALAWEDARWIEVEPEYAEIEASPIPLVLPLNAGWGTCLDLDSTRVFYRPIVPDRIIGIT